MGSILKALGLTIWGLVAFGLVAIFIFVGYEAAIKYRTSSGALVEEGTTNPQAKKDEFGASVPAGRALDLHNDFEPGRTPETTRKKMLDAAQTRQYQLAITYGQQLVDGNSAGPGDLSTVAQSYSAVGDCENARLWARRAQDAFQATGAVPDDSLRREIACCGSGLNNPAITLDSAQMARIDQLLSRTDAAKADTGGPFVRLGELYYGFGDYELAIASIQRGLKMGKLARPDEAYVYLGLSEKAVGDLEAARNAFSKLKDVPGISPRVLQLWTLFAETQLTKSANDQCSGIVRAAHESSSTGTTEIPGSGR